MHGTVRRDFTAVSLFTGGGGLTLGLEEAGFRTLFATDIEKASADTFARNHPDTPFYLKDIQHFTLEEIQAAKAGRSVDLVVGGPPCQGFSTLGDQNPADPRNVLFWRFVRMVEWLEAPCFLMENVNYLRTQYGGRFEREIVAAFERRGFRVWVTTLNAADYGCPQVRKRVFFFGARMGDSFEWPTPTHGAGRLPYETVWPAIADLASPESDVPNHEHLRHGDRVIARYRLVPEGGRMPPPSELPPEIRRKNFGNTYKRLHRDRPSLTLVPGNNAFPIHPTLHRSLSAREAARLQTFPDSYMLVGNRAEQCRLVGNAVPVALARSIGESIKDFLTAALNSHDTPINFSNNRENIAMNYTMSVPKFPKHTGLTAVSFFTGIGGMMLGFKNAGVEILSSYDLKKSVSRNLGENFPALQHHQMDIAKLTSGEVEDHCAGRNIDIVFGGPPCQGFSLFGRRRFVNTREHKPDHDARNELSLKFIELAIALAPRAIVMENVKGFTSTARKDSTYLADMEELLQRAGYEFKHRVVNCASYGVPQNRERFLLVAWKSGTTFLWPEPKHFSEPKPWQRRFVTVGDVISDLEDTSTHNAEFSHLPMNHKELVVERYKLIPEGGRLPEGTLPEYLRKGYRSESVKNFSHVYKRLSRSMPATTMVPGHNAFPIHPTLNRTLTVREAARIQTFPDWMRFEGTRQQQCLLVGNAVPPLLSEIFASKIVKMLNGNFSSEGYKRDIYDLAAAAE